MYRAGLESLLGVRVRGARLSIDPCIPRAWPGFEVLFTPQGARYRITVANPDHVSRGVKLIEVDGTPVKGDIPIQRDGVERVVRVVLGS